MSHQVRTPRGARRSALGPVLAWIVVGLALTTAGCTRTRIVVGEGIRCSTDEDDNPYNECDATGRLLCFSTYKKGNTDAWTCHRACEPGGAKCSTAGDVCCPAQVYPASRSESFACVPAGFCDATKNMPKPDGGAANDAGSTGSTDASASPGDASVDAPTANDAGDDGSSS